MSEMSNESKNTATLMCSAGLGELVMTDERTPELCRAHLDLIRQTTEISTKLEVFSQGFLQFDTTLREIRTSWFEEVTKRMQKGTVIVITSLVGLLTGIIGAIAMYALTHGGSTP